MNLSSLISSLQGMVVVLHLLKTFQWCSKAAYSFLFEVILLKALSKKNILIIAASALAAVIISIIIVFVLTRPESYRVLKSFEMTGTSSVERKDIGHLDVYVGMNFENEDFISTDKESSLRLALDSDKYVLLDELTVMELVAAGNQADSRTILKLREGNILNEITKPLSENSSYVVNAPKSTMAVRGTSFNVNVSQLEDGSYLTDVDVIHDHVDVQLLDENGDAKGDVVVVTEGNRVTIVTDQNEETSNDPDIDGNSYFVFHGVDESGEPTLFTYDTENTPRLPLRLSYASRKSKGNHYKFQRQRTACAERKHCRKGERRDKHRRSGSFTE